VLKRLPIRLKLILLAGVPVIGALILATSIASDARRQAESAAALGSIEDLARLSARMSELVHQLQFERNELSLSLGQGTSEALTQRFANTDQARRQLDDFLGGREVESLPPRLARDLLQAQTKLSALQAERVAAVGGKQPLDELLAYYNATDLSLISATAALAQLTDDGQLMRAILAVVTVLQIKERASQEHALLSHVFTLSEFPAGAYKDLVTLTTEEADYVRVLRFNATDSVNDRFTEIVRGPEFARTTELRRIAIDTVDDQFGVRPLEWSEAQGKKIEGYHTLEIALNDAVKVAALAKLADAQRAVRFSYGLGGGVIVLSMLLAGWIARGISRSVASLSEAAERVRRDKDFGVRARKTTDDELGGLTDAFNEMLAGIQGRDAELSHHRENLEQLVERRTAALSQRNVEMRLVLDNVDQGLATIELDGKLARERSRAFDAWFGLGEGSESFARQLARHEENVRASLELAWEQVVAGIFPVAASIDQMPRHIQVEDRHYDLDYRPILADETLRGALLVVSDVTQEMERIRRDAEQREMLSVFERMTRDRVGFLEFFKECEGLVAQITSGEITEPRLLMRAVHTVKGNCGMFGIGSVVEVAHRLEGAVLESGELPSRAHILELVEAWRLFSERVRRLSGAERESVVEVAYAELETLEAAAACGASQTRLSELLGRLKAERGIVRLRRLAEQAKSLADRLGKPGLQVELDAGDEVRFPAERWASFWASFVHVLRNAVHHGIEAPEARIAAGKSAQGRIQISAHADAQRLTITISDDGRGIGWARVREKAKELGLVHATEQELVDALFCDGLSTAEEVGDVSGRGVGLSAVHDAVVELGGTVSVSSTPGTGTTMRFDFPNSAAVSRPTSLPASGERRSAVVAPADQRQAG
jgi:two-component system, chemotaxis family, sensor kinase CheA